MKVHITIIATILLLLSLSCNGDDLVLICTGSSSYAYHKSRCQGLRQCRAEVKQVTLEKARSLHRKACGYCYGAGATAAPPPSSGSGDEKKAYKKSNSPARGGQCTAITKKRKRCSRNSRSNGLCWQHGG